MKKILIVLILFAVNISCAFGAVSELPEFNFNQRPNEDQFVYDYAHLMNAYSKERINNSLQMLYRDADMEFIAVSVKNLNGENINTWTNQLFENWKVGKHTKGNKGLLLVVAEEEKQVRLEVGKDLEYIYTDAFVGYIENEQMKPFFEEGRVGVGMEATLELIAGRAWDRINKGDYVPEESIGLGGTEYLSGGGGAKKDVDIGSVERQPKPSVLDDARNYFSAQPTPEAALQRYFEASQRHIKDPNLGIFTDATKEFFRNWTVTNAQQDNERQFDGVLFTTKIQGNHAVIYYPQKDWTFSPFFLEKGAEGWQLDFAVMSKVIQFNQYNYWRFVSFDHPYMFAFKEYKIDENGFVWFKRSEAQRGYINISFPYGKVPMEIRVVYQGSSAERAGMRVGDVITHVNGRDVRELGFQGAVNECVGSMGTTLDLTVYRPNENHSINFTIMREEERP